MVDFGNTCALVCRLVLLVVLILGIILSCLVVPSCHFISAITFNEETHGVGLESFENEGGSCEPHNSFVVKNYNGMEMAAKVGGYVAPTCASLVVLFLLIECCKQDGIFCGKCIPSILLLGALACQGITFLLFNSELFCSNKDIEKCTIGEAGYSSIYACLVYAFCLILYVCSPVPIPFSPPRNKQRSQQQSQQKQPSSSSSKKTKSEPAKDQEWTKEMYEQRREEKNVKSRGVAGRSKKEIFNDLNGKDKDDMDTRESRRARRKGKEKDVEMYHEKSITLYDPDKYDDRKRSSRSSRSSSKSRSSSQPPTQYDDYPDTEPDGMDWSAYTPDKREAYYDKQRSKKKEKDRRKRERKEEEQLRDGLREWERGVDDGRGGGGEHRHSRSSASEVPRSPRGGGGDYYDDSYRHAGSRYEDDYSNRDHGSGYEMAQQYRSDGNGRGGDYHGDYHDSPGSGRDSRDHRSRDDFSYAQDDYSYAQDSRGDPPDYKQPSRSSSKHSRSTGRSSSRGYDRQQSQDDSYYDDSYADSRGYRDDPSFV
mmetsp:Transcript_10780/g.19549  ORF Transcript_10780/g.19549 Transcript_10780/m.19549 type:complete len:538 (+) Transcript_10780:313-1926(+)